MQINLTGHHVDITEAMRKSVTHTAPDNDTEGN